MSMEKDNNSNPSGQTYIDKVKASIDFAVWHRITKDKRVKKALKATAEIGGAHTGKFYLATAHLLNCISHAYLKATEPEIDLETTAAIVFSSSRDKPIPGDYLRVGSTAGLIAFVDVTATLVSAVQARARTPYSELKPWSALVGIGEWNHKKRKDDELEDRALDLKRYRPDLPTAHSLLFDSFFFVEASDAGSNLFDSNDNLRLASVNAFGSWFSDPVTVGFESTTIARRHRTAEQKTIPATDAWIAYVVLLYSAHSRRDERFSLGANPSDDETALWDVDLPGFKPTVRPFYSPRCRGRMTWGSFVLDLSEPDAPPHAKGFLKTSWQSADARFYESRLLDTAHDGTWLPGVVRHRMASIDKHPLYFRDDPAYRPAMYKELVCLSSIGHPLSQCRSALHLLKVMYDATEANLQLLQADVLHGDMSWFNILCNPWHDDVETLAMQPVLPGVPCIDFILTGDEANSQPCALLVDLGHGATLTELYTNVSLRGYAKKATPMFLSVELSSKTPIACGTDNIYSLASIVDRLAALDSRPELFARAFPEGDDGFMNNFRNVLKKEEERIARREKAYTNPASRHRPHHEVESLYWVLLWGFARACPLGCNPDGEEDNAFSFFADKMLGHCLHAESLRSKYLFGFGPEEDIFHTLLQKEFYRAIRDLAIYLSVPWHLYCPDVHPGHAHVAMRRILLPLIDDIVKGKVEDVPFDTAQPRTIQTSRYGGYRKPSPGPRVSTTTEPLDRTPTSNMPDLTAPSSPSHLPSAKTVSTSSNSLTGEDTVVGDEPRSLSGDPPANLDEAGSQSHAAPRVKRARDDEGDEPAPKRAKMKGTETHSRDVEALIKMFWADRDLWFGSGFGKEADANAWPSDIYTS